MPNGVGVCTENYLLAAAMTESSERTAYPAANLLDTQRRTKVWRTNGFWLIEVGSNEIVFRESVGVDLTATIAAGEYSSTADFVVALKAALDAAGDSTYTVTYLAHGKFKIESNGAGGGGIFQLRMEHADSADMADILGFDTVAYTGSLEYTADVVRIHTSDWLVFDLGIATNPKAFCLVGDRNNPLRITSTAVIKLMGNPTNNWAAPAVELTIPYSDKALAVWDFEGLADIPAGYRYWKFEIVDRENARLYIELGAAFLGDMLAFTRGCTIFPLQLRGIDNSTIVVSEGGQVYGLERPKTMGIGLQWNALLPAEEEELLRHWEIVGLTKNWFLILDANGAFSTRKQDRVKLVRFSQEHQETLRTARFFDAPWQLEEAL